MKRLISRLWRALTRLGVNSDQKEPEAATPELEVRPSKAGDVDDAQLAQIALNLLAQVHADADEAKKRAFSLLSFSTALSVFLFGVVKEPLRALSSGQYGAAMGLIVLVLLLCAKCAFHCLRAVDWRHVVHVKADLISVWNKDSRAASLVAECAFAYPYADLARASRTEHANLAQDLATLQTVVALSTVGMMTFWSPRVTDARPVDDVASCECSSAPATSAPTLQTAPMADGGRRSE